MKHYLTTPTGRKDAPAPSGKHYTLEELYDIIGCEYVQVVYLGDLVMICDEDAKLKGITDVNHEATALAKEYGAIFHDDYFVGKVLVCDKKLLG